MLIVVEILCALIVIFVIAAAVLTFVRLKREEKKIALSYDTVLNGIRNYAKACAIAVPAESDPETMRALLASCEEAFTQMNADAKRNCLRIREKTEKSVGEYDASVNAYNERIGTFPICIVTSLMLRKEIRNFRNNEKEKVIGK